MTVHPQAPATGPEFGAEAERMVGVLADRHAGHPILPDVLNAFAAIPHIADDETMVRVARGVIPAYIASYWADPAPWTEFQKTIQATYISGMDEHGAPDTVDDREALATLSVPTLILVGRFDVICGERWAEELYKLIPGSRLLVLENSGHFGHLEEPEVFAESVTAFIGNSN